MHARVRLVPQVRRRPGGALALVLLAAAAAPAAAAPRDELLRLVPDDVGFCLLLQDLRGHAAALRDSPFVEQVRASALGQALRGIKELDRLEAVEHKLLKHLDLDWNRLREDILGDALVLAYKPGPPGKEDEEQGLVLVRARDGKLLTDLVARVNKLQKESGELKELEERDWHGVKYYKRADRKDTGYYSLRGPVLLYSGQEDMLRRALDREQAPAAEPAVARALHEMGAENALFALWINPRALDAQVEGKAAKAAEKEPDRAAGQRTVAACWKAIDAVVVAVHLDRDLAISLGVRGRPADMPTGVRRFLAECSRPSELWRVFPDHALFAVALHVNAPALFDAVGDFLPAEARAALRADINLYLNAILGQDFVKDVLPAVGPDWGVCVTPPAADEKGWFPKVLAAIRLSPGGGPTPVDQAVLSALGTAAQVAVLGHNKTHPDHPLSLHVDKADKQEVKYLSGDLPSGLRPALGLRDGYLLLTSSPDVLRRFHDAGPVPAAPAETPLLRISFKEARAYLKERREALVQALADKEGLTAEDAGRRLDAVLTGLQFVDRVELRQRTAPGQVVFTLAVQPAQSFRK